MARSKIDEKQSERFKEAARELGCDDSEDRFREVMRQVAKAKPAPKGENTKPAAKDKAKG